MALGSQGQETVLSHSSLLIFWSVLSMLALRRSEKAEESPVSMNLATHNSPFILAGFMVILSEDSRIIGMRQVSKD